MATKPRLEERSRLTSMLMDADFRVQPMLAEALEDLPETYPYLQLYLWAAS